MSKSRPTLDQLEMRGNFINRHIGPNQQQIKEMLAELGLNELEDIIGQAIPANILNHEPLKLTETISECAVINYLRKMRGRNKVFTSMIGMCYFDIPPWHLVVREPDSRHQPNIAPGSPRNVR